MKTKSKVLVSALVAIVLCVSLIAGATFALFTSESSVNITVSSGKVDVKAAIGNLATSSLGVAQENGAWANGGKATVTGNTVSLENIMPGDSVSFDIAVDNSDTTVSAKYRLNYTVENGYLLADGLTIGITGLLDGTAKYKSYSTAWSEEVAATYPVTITLPNHTDSKIDNLYQGLSATITFKVEAVQANGVADNGEAEFELLPDYTEIKDTFSAGEKVVKVDSIEDFEIDSTWFGNLSGGTYILTQDLNAEFDLTGNRYTGIVFYYDTMLDLNGYNLTSNCKFLSIAGLTIKNGTMNMSATEGNAGLDLQSESVLTLENVDYDCSGEAMSGILMIHQAKAYVKNSSIKGNWYAVGTNASAQYASDNTVVIENSQLSAVHCAVLFNVAGSITIKNSEITGGDHAVFVRCGEGTIDNCKLTQTGEYDNSYDEKWGGGNNAPFSALLIGNKSTSAYRTAANVTVTNTVLTNNATANKIYMHGNSEEGLGASLVYDGNESDVVIGNEHCTLTITNGD